jgi:hypothetical protein
MVSSHLWQSSDHCAGGSTAWSADLEEESEQAVAPGGPGVPSGWAVRRGFPYFDQEMKGILGQSEMVLSVKHRRRKTESRRPTPEA